MKRGKESKIIAPIGGYARYLMSGIMLVILYFTETKHSLETYLGKSSWMKLTYNYLTLSLWLIWSPRKFCISSALLSWSAAMSSEIMHPITNNYCVLLVLLPHLSHAPVPPPPPNGHACRLPPMRTFPKLILLHCVASPLWMLLIMGLGWKQKRHTSTPMFPCCNLDQTSY
jgi:hypothetical protein